ncbi:hypothetical protein DIPPA_07772 [Diplonema papillatum]|nr:hypothetical protein DIPPA_07772 [Diplonema papillatum]
MPQIKTRGKSKQQKRTVRSREAQRNRSKLEKILDVDLVESRDRIEVELAKVRPVLSKKRKRAEELTPKKQPRVADQPKTKTDPLNPLKETHSQIKQRTQGRRNCVPAAPGPGVERRAKEVKSESSVCKLLAKIAERRKKAEAGGP